VREKWTVVREPIGKAISAGAMRRAVVDGQSRQEAPCFRLWMTVIGSPLPIERPSHASKNPTATPLDGQSHPQILRKSQTAKRHRPLFLSAV